MSKITTLPIHHFHPIAIQVRVSLLDEGIRRCLRDDRCHSTSRVNADPICRRQPTACISWFIQGLNVFVLMKYNTCTLQNISGNLLWSNNRSEDPTFVSAGLLVTWLGHRCHQIQMPLYCAIFFPNYLFQQLVRCLLIDSPILH